MMPEMQLEYYDRFHGWARPPEGYECGPFAVEVFEDAARVRADRIAHRDALRAQRVKDIGRWGCKTGADYLRDREAKQ